MSPWANLTYIRFVGLQHPNYLFTSRINEYLLHP